MRVLLADDEPLAREGLKLLLAPEKDIEIVSVCEDGISAAEQILALKPDLVLLDISMPGLTGLEVIEKVGAVNMPLVIFLTAYDDYAIQAFSLNALDYVLKPIVSERFSVSLDRARAEFKVKNTTQQQAQLESLLEQLAKHKHEESAEERLMVRDTGHVYFLKPKEIIWVEAEGDYVSIHTQQGSHLIRETMKNMQMKLADSSFQRVHRSSIININFVRELITTEQGNYQVILTDATSLSLSRSYRDELCEKLQGKL